MRVKRLLKSCAGRMSGKMEEGKWGKRHVKKEKRCCCRLMAKWAGAGKGGATIFLPGRGLVSGSCDGSFDGEDGFTEGNEEERTE